MFGGAGVGGGSKYRGSLHQLAASLGWPSPQSAGNGRLHTHIIVRQALVVLVPSLSI